MEKLITLWQNSPPYHAINRFFEGRVPRSDHIRLGLKNVYIFFSRQGFLFAMLLFLTFILGVNYANNLVLGLFFYLFGIWLVGVFYTFVQVSSLEVRLVETQLAPADSLSWVTLEISTRSGKPSRQIRLRFDDKHFDGISDEEDGQRTLILTAVGSPMLIKLPVYAPKRGMMTLPRLVIESTYPLGVMKAWAYAYFDSLAPIYPKPKPFVWQDADQRTASQDNAEYSPFMTVGQDDFDKLDEYQQGESLARVSWTHFARGAGMLTKHFADPIGGQTRLAYADMPSANHEHKLSQLCFALLQLQETKQPFVLVLANGTSVTGVGDEFVRSCLTLLAKEP